MLVCSADPERNLLQALATGPALRAPALRAKMGASAKSKEQEEHKDHTKDTKKTEQG
jgi:hypothetical protein